jgi:hypothetical protein
MVGFNSKIPHTLVLFATALFAVMSIFTLLHAGSMGFDGDMSMTHCPFMQSAVLCDMSPLEHASKWHGVFSILLAEASILIFAALFLVSGIIDSSRQKLAGSLFFTPREYAAGHFLQFAFSKGILHPKLF